jgi:hypothetical protein
MDGVFCFHCRVLFTGDILKSCNKRIIFYFFYVSLFFSFGKISGQEAYDKLRSKYENLSENDGSALQHINLFIQKAKQEKIIQHHGLRVSQKKL